MSVIFVKTCLQLLGCVYLREAIERDAIKGDKSSTACVTAQVFSIRCLNANPVLFQNDGSLAGTVVIVIRVQETVSRKLFAIGTVVRVT